MTEKVYSNLSIKYSHLTNYFETFKLFIYTKILLSTVRNI